MAQPIPIEIQNRSYGALKDQPLFISADLKKDLEKRKFRDGTRAYDALLLRGFRGGKHLIELIRAELGSDCALVLSDGESSIGAKRVVVNYEAFREAGQARFFEVYRQTGLRTATQFLNEAFPETFTRTSDDVLPETKEVKRVLSRLPEAAEAIPKRERKKLPERIADLVERQGADFAFDLLSSVDAAIPKGQKRIQVAFQDVIKRLAKEPAKALDELTDLMEEWNLLQVTALVNILVSRINTIDTLEDLVLDDNTYELKGDKSIHRTLEKSMWLLNDEYWIAQSNRSLRKIIGQELAKSDRKYAKNRPDFACVDLVGKRPVLVEIKRPSVEIKKPEVDQAELYLRLIRKHQGQKKNPLIYLIGRKISDEARELADMRDYPVLWTYQDMIENARRRYQEYLRIIEGDK
ncbi:MAG: hypothetical protein ACRDIX_05790 [Actinomycetota bacterium]